MLSDIRLDGKGKESHEQEYATYVQGRPPCLINIRYFRYINIYGLHDLFFVCEWMCPRGHCFSGLIRQPAIYQLGILFIGIHGWSWLDGSCFPLMLQHMLNYGLPLNAMGCSAGMSLLIADLWGLHWPFFSSSFLLVVG